MNKKLNDLTWSEIAEISRSAKAEEVFSIGDTKIETLENGEYVTFVIIDFNHDISSKSKETVGITFGTKNLLQDFVAMNDEWSNAGGWEKSKMRNEHLKKIFSQLPKELQDEIIVVDKATSLGSRSEQIGITEDTLFLLSEVEVQGKAIYSAEGEGKLYPYFEDKCHKNKYRNEDNYSNWWWLRSPITGNASVFRLVIGNGGGVSSGASAAGGVSFCFCI